MAKYTAADFDYLPEADREEVAELVNHGSHIAATVTRNTGPTRNEPMIDRAFLESLAERLAFLNS